MDCASTHLGGAPGEAKDWILVIGDAPLAARVCGAISGRQVPVQHLLCPADLDLQQALRSSPGAAAIIVREDVAALRYALAIAHLDASLRLVVTIFDRTVADRLRSLLPQATVTSPADIAVASLVGPCLAPDVIAAWSSSSDLVYECVVTPTGLAVRESVKKPRRLLRQIWERIFVKLASHDGGTKLMIIGLAGLAGALVTDWLWLTVLQGHDALEALLDSARVVATVGPGAVNVSPAYAIFSTVCMMSTLVFTALFTAGLIDRFIEPRLLGVLGTRTPARSGHVLVVGMGQVGLRLCAELRRLGIPVVGVERDPNAPQLRRARILKIPVVAGHGGDRELLERMSVRKCRAIAAVGSDDLDNIAVAIAANAVSPHTPVVMRAGEQEAIAETRSLIPLGVTRDVLHLAATYVLSVLLDGVADPVVLQGETACFLSVDGVITRAPVQRQDCTHGREEVSTLLFADRVS